MREITNEQAAYIAGFLEGEGSFIITRPGGSFQPKIGVGQRLPKVLGFMASITGIGKVVYRRGYGRNNPAYYWKIETREEVIDLIRRIYSYLISPRTKRRAWCVFKAMELRGSYLAGRPQVSQENFEKRKEVYELWSTTRR